MWYKIRIYILTPKMGFDGTRRLSMGSWGGGLPTNSNTMTIGVQNTNAQHLKTNKVQNLKKLRHVLRAMLATEHRRYELQQLAALQNRKRSKLRAPEIVIFMFIGQARHYFVNSPLHSAHFLLDTPEADKTCETMAGHHHKTGETFISPISLPPVQCPDTDVTCGLWSTI